MLSGFHLNGHSSEFIHRRKSLESSIELDRVKRRRDITLFYPVYTTPRSTEIVLGIILKGSIHLICAITSSLYCMIWGGYGLIYFHVRYSTSYLIIDQFNRSQSQ